MPDKTLFFTKSQIIKLLERRSKVAGGGDDIEVPELLQEQKKLWNNYPSNEEIEKERKGDGSPLITAKERRNNDINKCFELVITHLKSLGVSEELLVPYKEEGLLRKNIVDHNEEDQVVFYMNEMLTYVSLLSQFTDKDRDAALEEYPKSLLPSEYACLEGTRDRQLMILMRLQMKAYLPAEQAILDAHDAVVEETRKKFSPLIYDGGQPHVKPAVEYIYGFNDKSKSHAKTTSYLL